MRARTLTVPASPAALSRTGEAKRSVPRKRAAPVAYDDMTEEQLYTLLDQRLGDLERRVVAGRARTEQLLKRLG